MEAGVDIPNNATPEKLSYLSENLEWNFKNSDMEDNKIFGKKIYPCMEEV